MTGVPEPTLRAWERRYNIPRPERTASGYRLYSLQEVEQVRAMRSACDGGMSASEAADWVRSRAAIVGETMSAVASLTTTVTPGTTPAGTLDSFVRARRELLGAVERLDDHALEGTLRRVMFLGDATTILEQVIKPSLIEIGVAWHAGKLTVAHEHFASQRFTSVLRDLIRLSSPPARPGEQHRRALLASFADDEHEMGLLGLAIHLGSWGISTVFLGARTPPNAVRNAIEQVHPALVALSITATPTPARARELVDEYARACEVEAVPWLVGGGAVDAIEDLVLARGGVIDPGSPEELQTVVREMLSGKSRESRESRERGGAKKQVVAKKRRRGSSS